jgi:hypothetical protein
LLKGQSVGRAPEGARSSRTTSLRLDRVLDVVPVDDGIRRRAAGRGQGRRVGDRPRGRLVGVVVTMMHSGLFPAARWSNVMSDRTGPPLQSETPPFPRTASVAGGHRERQRAGRLPRRDLVQVDVT